MDTNINPKLLKTFDERAAWFLNYIYEDGGNEYKESDYNSFSSRGIIGASNANEFDRIVNFLIDKGWVSCNSKNSTIGGPTYYLGIKLTIAGIEEAKKTLPQIPLFGLVSQEITTGDFLVDSKINHARQLFFSNPQTMENMRSACEALSFVIEPLRNDLTQAISVADVNEFFLIVNRFDIRHNKDSTKNLIHPEQLEWVFYGLLNTINTYTKLKKRLGAL